MGKYVFVSSWTETSEESIPFWKMYTDNMSGVRIRFKTYPFQTYRLPQQNKDNIKINLDEDIFFKPTYFFNDNYIVLPRWDILQKVEYTDEKDLLFPNIIRSNEGNTEMKFGLLGKHKRVEWKFQREWRYIITFLPVSLRELNTDGNIAQLVHDRLAEKHSLPFDDLFLNIADEAWDDMEITLGPCVNEGDKIIVRSLVKKILSNSKHKK